MSSAKVTRRELLVAGVGLTGTALLFGLPSLGALSQLGDARHLKESTYRPLVGDTFQVTSSSGTSDLRLAGVRNLGPLQYGSRLIAGREHFALDFEGRSNSRLQSSLHALSHPNLGQFQLFLTPVGPAGSVQRYEAIINRFDITTWRWIYG